MNLRNDGLKWFEEHHNSREPIRVSKFYPAHESWKKGPVWWFEFPPHDVSNPNGWINLLCQRQNDPSSFHHLHIPMGLFAGCKHLIGFREDKNVYSLFLSAEPESLFREMRGSGNIEFGVFEHDCKFNTFAQVTLESWEDIHEYSKQGWIYRGQRSVDWSLQTSLERCYNRHSIPKDRYSEVESDLLRAFRRAYHHYSQHVPSTTTL
jgi:hypothetical protein